MNLASLALVSVSLLSLLAVGCKRDDDDGNDSDLGTVESQLIADDSEASEADDDAEVGIDEPLSGATEEEPGNPADGANDDEVFEKFRANPGRFFKPAGCIASTREGATIRHVFKGCRGPWDLANFEGTVTSTYLREAGKLTITHEATDFAVNGAKITGTRVVVYTREGSVITKTRTGDWSGTTARGRDIRHKASFVSTYDSATRCVTRDGSAETTIGGRSFERVVEDYKRCGIGRLGCPVSGKLTLTRTKSDETASVSLELLGGTEFRVTRPNGRQVTRNLVCRPNAG